jgi:hypothetical protein
VRAPADLACGIDPRQARHVHVEEADVGAVRFEQPDRVATIAGLRDDRQLGPGLRQLPREGIAQQRFVVGDEGCRAHQASAGCAGLPGAQVRLQRAQRQHELREHSTLRKGPVKVLGSKPTGPWLTTSQNITPMRKNQPPLATRNSRSAQRRCASKRRARA